MMVEEEEEQEEEGDLAQMEMDTNGSAGEMMEEAIQEEDEVMNKMSHVIGSWAPRWKCLVLFSVDSVLKGAVSIL